MKDFIIDLGKDCVDTKPCFQRIVIQRTVTHMFTGEVHHKILIEDQSGYIDERWITDGELEDLKKMVTYNMMSDRLY